MLSGIPPRPQLMEIWEILCCGTNNARATFRPPIIAYGWIVVGAKKLRNIGRDLKTLAKCNEGLIDFIYAWSAGYVVPALFDERPVVVCQHRSRRSTRWDALKNLQQDIGFRHDVIIWDPPGKCLDEWTITQAKVRKTAELKQQLHAHATWCFRRSKCHKHCLESGDGRYGVRARGPASELLHQS